MKGKTIVFLDGYTVNPGDLSWASIEQFGDLQVYDRTPKHLVIERARVANIIITNKVVFDAEVLRQLPNLELICVAATGYNIIDVTATKSHKIPVCNVQGYSAPSAAQHVFAMLLRVLNEVANYNDKVAEGTWERSADWCFYHGSITELKDLVFGIYGFGQIGQAVGKVADAFGMKVIAHHKHPDRDAKDWVEMVTMDELLLQSDVLSLHAPLTDKNAGLIDHSTLNRMKRSAVLINTARGGLIHEEDLAEALKEGRIRAACLDVLSSEPPASDNPLIGIKNCYITPHIAWATQSSRQRLLNGIASNIEGFLEGTPRNIVNL